MNRLSDQYAREGEGRMADKTKVDDEYADAMIAEGRKG